MKVLVTGGAGYVGSVIVSKLIRAGHSVTVYDNLTFGGDHLIPLFENPNFHFVKGDILDEDAFSQSIKGNDIIVHLAAIVGYPACRSFPDLAKSVNVDGTKVLMKYLSPDQRVIYASTGSNYGKVDDVCTEETELKPLSLYGQTKTLAESMLLEKLDEVVVYRFATAFGVSPRLRLDLLINDFTYKCKTQGYIVVYERSFKRTFIHVRDMGRAIMMAINDGGSMQGNVYNVGSDTMNFTKMEICDIISEETGAYIHYAEVGEDKDKRDYEVSYDKVGKLGFNTTVGIREGIQELVRAFDVVEIKNKYINI